MIRLYGIRKPLLYVPDDIDDDDIDTSVNVNDSDNDN